ncbi:hypothetical protein LRAMOSA08681 [Lichtheimia ramosa]|uniref:glucan endo-1,3-beta-D-glucosidase n=1 Tax=Lichtheimia ramosa TaxID=688394 RepID=A0A077WGG7_9FUNG|nr:hypothetical protein LRAMOSA08681 [Lichtheimia ramosa]
MSWSPQVAAAPFSSANTAMMDLLVPLSQSPPNTNLFPKIQHPYPPEYADPRSNNVVPTNSWISNLFYHSVEHLAPTTPDPYTLRIFDGYGGNPGLSIRQPSKKVFGSYPPMNDVPYTESGYMINSVVVDLRFTCSEWGLGSKPTQSVTSWDHFSANLELSTAPGDQRRIEFPLVRGMAYVTAIYHNLTPQFFTQHAIIRVEADSHSGNERFMGRKFKISMNDDPTTTFLIYALGDQPLELHRDGTSNLVASRPYNGPIRVAKLPNAGDESTLDNSRGVWPTGGRLRAQGSREQGEYHIEWQTQGDSADKLLMYAYPHHLDSLTNTQRTRLTLQSATKGAMTAVVGSRWSLVESSLSPVEWLPLNPAAPASAINEIMAAMDKDLQSDYTAETLLDDNYFSGKGLQKFAMLALVLNKPELTQLRNPELAATSLEKLKNAFLPYLENRQHDPFRYDSVYRGIVARDGLPTSMGGKGDVNAEFGHTLYNDHHYHQGYLIVTAAIIHYLDPHWRSNEITQWTETLIRDVNTPVDNDPYYAPFRNWDWFAGHSWAGGIKINGALDGRDQESIPESVNFYWGTKLWGLATNNDALVNLAALQLAITKRTTYEYFWMLDDNKNRPPNIIQNKVIGIYFEQKADYTTYFGRYVEYIHGIQQLPMTPALADDIRTPEFVGQEWQQKLASIAPNVRSPWAGVLYLNYALLDPSTAYTQLRRVPVDDGQTRSFSLYLASTRGNFRRGLRLNQNINSSLPMSPETDLRAQNRIPFSSSAVNIIRHLGATDNKHDDRYNGY